MLITFPQLLRLLVAAGLLLMCLNGQAQAGKQTSRDHLTISFRETSIQEVYEMLSQQKRVNILLGKGVSGKVSVNLYDVDIGTAIRLVADAAGYIVEERNGSYTVLVREESGKDVVSSNTRIRTFKVQYTDPSVVEELLTKHLSRYGKITVLEDRHLLVVEDLPDFVERVDKLLAKIDVQPQQILIEAKVLEITLDQDQAFGIDWNKIGSATNPNRTLSLGTRSLAPGTPAAGTGFFFNYVTPNLTLFLSALNSKGRVRTLSTPKLLTLENQEAQVLIGDRLGFKVTTTINQVTTESIEFIESGVILKVTASVDRSGKILLKIHPEVSTGSITNGIPNVTTTEVTTQFLADDGEQLFIGGLIKNRDTESRTGMPLLSDIPILGNLFSRTDTAVLKTETVVMIRPRIIQPGKRMTSSQNAQHIDHVADQQQLKFDSVLSSLPSVVDNYAAKPAQNSRSQLEPGIVGN